MPLCFIKAYAPLLHLLSNFMITQPRFSPAGCIYICRLNMNKVRSMNTQLLHSPHVVVERWLDWALRRLVDLFLLVPRLGCPFSKGSAGEKNLHYFKISCDFALQIQLNRVKRHTLRSHVITLWSQKRISSMWMKKLYIYIFNRNRNIYLHKTCNPSFIHAFSDRLTVFSFLFLFAFCGQLTLSIKPYHF